MQFVHSLNSVFTAWVTNLDEGQFICSFIDGAFSVVAKKSLPNLKYKDFPPAFEKFFS